MLDLAIIQTIRVEIREIFEPEDRPRVHFAQ